jgi:hypothetical protein
VDQDLAVAVRRGGDRDRTRAGGRRLPHAALPDPRRDLAVALDADDLDVRALGEPRVRLEERSDADDLGGIAADDGVRVPDRHADELDPLDRLGRADRDRPELLLHLGAAQHARADLAVADADADALCPGPLREPARGDSRPVAGHLGCRPVRVPDHHVRPVRARGDHLDDAVGVAN